MSSAVLGGGTSIFSANTNLLNGTDQYYDAGNPTEVQITDAITVACWVKLGTLSGGRFVMTKYGESSDRDWYILLHGGTGLLTVQVQTTGVTTTISDPTTPTVDEWLHVAFTYNKVNVILYVNGVQVAIAANTSSLKATSAPVRIGVNSATIPSSYMDGSLPFPSINDTALSAATILEMYNSGVPICTADQSTDITDSLVYAPRLANWDTNAGDELVDQSTSGITTTAFNTPTYTDAGLDVECT